MDEIERSTRRQEAIERNTEEAQAVLLAILVDRLGGSVTITEGDAHTMRNSGRRVIAMRDPRQFAWTIALLPDPTTGD